MNLYYAIAVVAIALSFSGCSRGSSATPGYHLINGTPTSWSMTPDEVVLTAKKYCESNTIIVTGKEELMVSHVAFDAHRRWAVTFDDSGRSKPGFWVLTVDDETGAVKHVGGIK